MQAKKRERALHDPAQALSPTLPWKSGAEDARTPNADAWSADSAASAKRLECVRFIGAFRPAREGQQFMAAMHSLGIVEAGRGDRHGVWLESLRRFIPLLISLLVFAAN